MAKVVKLKKIVCNGGNPGPRLLITGGVHGDEFEPMAAIRQLATQLDQEALAGSVAMVPVVNEAAFQCGSRMAEDGLDLAATLIFRRSMSNTMAQLFAIPQEY